MYQQSAHFSLKLARIFRSNGGSGGVKVIHDIVDGGGRPSTRYSTHDENNTDDGCHIRYNLKLIVDRWTTTTTTTTMPERRWPVDVV